MKGELDCILLIDDDSTVNFLHQSLIHDQHLTKNLLIAETGEEALKLLNQSTVKPGIIFLDLNMPKMDGWEFIEAYQNLEIENKEDITIAMLSSSSNPADKAKAESIEVVAEFRQKPMNKAALFDILTTNFPELLEKVVLS